MTSKKKSKPNRKSPPTKAMQGRAAPRPAVLAGSSITATPREAGLPLDLDELAKRAGYGGPAARKRLTAELESLLQSGEIIRNRRDEYCLRERLPLTVGTVSGHKDGHGFVMPDDRTAPIFLAPRQMLEVMHGDRVAVRIEGADNRGRPQGSIVKVLERNTGEIVGRLYDESGICFVVPDNPRIGHRVLVPRDRLGGARA